MLSLVEARARILTEAVPGDAIEVTLTEALGLILAEPLIADVDLPPFDRAGQDGYAVRASEATTGARLNVVVTTRSRKTVGVATGRSAGAATAEVILDPGETAHVSAGDPMPVGADAVVRVEDSRPEPGVGPPREILVFRGATVGQSVVPRGYFLRAGTTLAQSGERVRLPMVGLLAAEGCIHPLCHRRVRVAVLAVGDHLVGPSEAPVMHRERNACGPTVVAPCLQWGATAHDLGTISERSLSSALHRALTANVVVIVGEPEGAIPRALKKAGVEPIFEGVGVHPGKRFAYGVVRDSSGRAAHHVIHMAPGPVGVFTGVMLLLGPLIARLHGASLDSIERATLRAEWSGPQHRPTDDRHWAVPVTLRIDERGRLLATPFEHRGKDDLLGFSRAEALAVLPPRSGPWNAGDVVDVVAIGPFGL
jgi:molybdopterin molybdotransferase